MKQSSLHQYLFFKKDNSNLIIFLGAFVDGAMEAKSSEFATQEENKSKIFDVKNKTKSLPMKFGGLSIRKTDNFICIDQWSIPKP